MHAGWRDNNTMTDDLTMPVTMDDLDPPTATKVGLETISTPYDFHTC